jgi:hypothetical protein
MYKTTFNVFNNNIEFLTARLDVNSVVFNSFSSILTNILLKRTEYLYNITNHILLISNHANPFEFAMIIAKKYLLYTSKNIML